MFFYRSLKSAWDYEKPPKVQRDVVDMQNISSVGAFYAGIGQFYSKHRILVPMYCGKPIKKEIVGKPINKIIKSAKSAIRLTIRGGGRGPPFLIGLPHYAPPGLQGQKLKISK